MHEKLHDLAWLGARAFAYVAFAAAGLAVLLHPPVSYEGLGLALTITWGVLLLIPGLVSAAGTVLRRYTWEWVATWPLTAGVAIYAFLSWGAALEPGALGNLPRALILTGAAMFFLARALQLWMEDRRARLALVTQQEVRDARLPR